MTTENNKNNNNNNLEGKNMKTKTTYIDGTVIVGNPDSQLGQMVESAIELKLFQEALRAEDRALRREKKAAEKAAAPFKALKKALMEEIAAISQISAWDIWANNCIAQKEAQKTFITAMNEAAAKEASMRDITLRGDIVTTILETHFGSARQVNTPTYEKIMAAKAFHKAQATKMRGLCRIHTMKSRKPNKQHYSLRKYQKWLESRDVFNAPRDISTTGDYYDPNKDYTPELDILGGLIFNTGSVVNSTNDVVFNVQRFAYASDTEGGANEEDSASAQQQEGNKMKFKCKFDDMQKLVHDAKTLAFVQAKVAQLGGEPYRLYTTKSGKVIVSTITDRVVIDGFSAGSVNELVEAAIVNKNGVKTVDQLSLHKALDNIGTAQIKWIKFDGETLKMGLKKQVFEPTKGKDDLFVYPTIIFDGKSVVKDVITYEDALDKQIAHCAEDATAVANLAKLGELAKAQAEEEAKERKVGEVHDREHYNKIAGETTKNDAGDSIHITGLFLTEDNFVVSKILRQTATPETKSLERYLKETKVSDGLFYQKVERYLDQKITVTFATQQQYAVLVNGKKFRTIYRVGDRFFWYDQWTKLFVDVMSHEKISSKKFWEMTGENRTYIVFDGTYTTASAGNQKNKTIELNGKLVSGDISYVKKHGVPWAQVVNNYMNGAWQMAKFYEELGYRGTFEDNCKTPIRMTQSKPGRRQFHAAPRKIGVDFKGLNVDGNVVARASWAAEVLSTEWRKIDALSLVGKTYQMRSILGLKVTVTFLSDEAFDIIEGRRTLVKNWDLEAMSAEELKENMFFGGKTHKFGEEERAATLKGQYHTFVTKSEYVDAKTDIIVDMDGNKIAGLIESMEQGFGFLSQISDDHEDGVLSSQAERTLDLYMGRYAFEFLTSRLQVQADKIREHIKDFRRGRISQRELREGIEETINSETGEVSRTAADINWADLAQKIAPDTVFSTIPRALMAAYNQDIKKLMKMLNNRNYPTVVKHFMMQPDPCMLLFGVGILGVDENGYTEMFVNDLPEAERHYGNIAIEKITDRIKNLEKDAWGNIITDEEKEVAINCYKFCHYGQVIVSTDMYMMKALEGYDFDGDSLYIYIFEDIPMNGKKVQFKIAIRYPKTHLMGAAILSADEELRENEYFKTVCVDICQDKLGKKISTMDYQMSTASGIGAIAVAINAAIGAFNAKNANIKEILGGEDGKGYTVRSILGLDSSRMGFEGSFNYAIQCAKQVGEVINSFTPLVDELIYVKLLEDDEKFMAAFKSEKVGDVSIAAAWKTLKLTQAKLSSKYKTVQTSWKAAVKALEDKGDYYSWLAVTNIVQTTRAIFKVKPFIGSTFYEIAHNEIRANSQDEVDCALEGSKYDDCVAYEKTHNNYTESCLNFIEAAEETQNMDVYRVNLAAAEKAIAKCWRQEENQYGNWVPKEGKEGLNNRLWLSQVKLMAMDFNAIIRFYAESTIDQVKKPVANAILGIMNETELRCSRLMSKRITLDIKLAIEEDDKGVKQFVGKLGAAFDGRSAVKRYDAEDYKTAKSLSTLMLREKDGGAFKAQVHDICYEQTVKDVTIIEQLAKEGLEDLKSRKFEMPKEFVDKCLQLIYRKVDKQIVLSDKFVANIYASFDVLQRMWRNANTAVRLMEEELAAQKISESSDTWKAQMDTIKARKRIVFKEIINVAYCTFEAAGVTDFLEKNAYVWISSAIGTQLWKNNIPVKTARAMLTTNMNSFNTSFLGPDYLRFILALADMRHRADEAVLETATKTFDRLYLTGWKYLEDISVLDGAKVMVRNGSVTYQGKNYGYVKDTEMNGVFSVYVDIDENGTKVPYIVEDIDKLLPETKGDFTRTVVQLHAYSNIRSKGQVMLNANETLKKVAGKKVYLVFTDMDKKGKKDLGEGAKAIYEELAKKQSLIGEKEAGLFIIEDGKPEFLGTIQGCTFRADDCAPALRKVYGCKNGIMEGIVEMGMKSAWFKKNNQEVNPDDYEYMTEEEIEKSGYETVTSCILCLSEFTATKDEEVIKKFENTVAIDRNDITNVWIKGTFKKVTIGGYDGNLLIDETHKYVFRLDDRIVKGYLYKEGDTWGNIGAEFASVDYTPKRWNSRIG